MSNRFIITTSIQEPTEASRQFCKVKGWTPIFVMDKKTPVGLYQELKNAIVLTVEDQEKLYPKLSEAVGWNCIQRRNLGFAYAYNNAAEYIYTTDDDNILLDQDLSKHLVLDKEIECTRVWCNFEVFEPFEHVGQDYKNKWMRGYPPSLVKYKQSQNFIARKIKKKFDIQQAWWTGAADVDGICRLIYGDWCEKYNDVFPFTSDKLMPIDSQSTFLSRDVLPHCPMFTHVGRLDDLYAMYYAQSRGFSAVYTSPLVKQERNAHDTVKDIEGECHGYRNIDKIILDLYKDPESIWQHVPEATRIMHQSYSDALK